VRFANPRNTDIEKYLLAKEADGSARYTNKKYGFTDVFGDHPQVDVEHIIPRSRSLDDSYVNKTLAYLRRTRKRATGHHANGSSSLIRNSMSR